MLDNSCEWKPAWSFYRQHLTHDDRLKRAYRSERAANKAVRRSRGYFQAYQCVICGCWHLTSKGASHAR